MYTLFCTSPLFFDDVLGSIIVPDFLHNVMADTTTQCRGGFIPVSLNVRRF